jgi:hypothetical protein
VLGNSSERGGWKRWSIGVVVEQDVGIAATKKNQLDIKGIAGIGFAIRLPSIICVSFAVYSQSDGGDRGGAHGVGFPNIAGMAAEAGRAVAPASAK